MTKWLTFSKTSEMFYSWCLWNRRNSRSIWILLRFFVKLMLVSIVSCRTLFPILVFFFWSLYCMFFFNLWLLITPFDIFWLPPLVSSDYPLWYLLITLFGIFWLSPLVSSDYPLWYLLITLFGIFWLPSLVSSDYPL